MKLKVRAYALFQFLSLLAIVLLFIGMMVSMAANRDETKTGISFWGSELKNIFSFGSEGVSSGIGSALVYIALVCYVSTWVIGWLVFKVKNRNFFDSMFLLFLMVPLVSNIFCLLAQFSLNTSKFTSSQISETDIEKEKQKLTQMIELKMKKGKLAKSLAATSKPKTTKVVKKTNKKK